MRNIEKKARVFEEKAKILRARALKNWACLFLESISKKIEIEQARRAKVRA